MGERPTKDFSLISDAPKSWDSSVLEPAVPRHDVDMSSEEMVELKDQLELTVSHIGVDGTSLIGTTREFAVLTLVKAIFLARARDNDEVLVSNPLPWINEYCGRPCDATEAQHWFEVVVDEASDILKWDAPVIRLTRSRFSLDFRLYLAGTKPNDYYFLENWLCESRV